MLTTDTSITSSFIRQGIIPCAPYRPSYGFSIRVLELYRTTRMRSPRLAIQPFVKALADLQGVPFHGYRSKQFTICFDLYLAIRLGVEQRVQVELGRDAPDWRLRHICPACTYKLTNEQKLRFSMLYTGDGNDSLKRDYCKEHSVDPIDEDGDVVPVLGPSSAQTDTRAVGQGIYLSREAVDKWAKEALEMMPDEEVEDSEDNPCAQRWKNMIDELTSKVWGVFDETGIFLTLCRHGFVLMVADMVRSGELAKYPLAVVDSMLDTFGSDLAFGYDIGCKFGSTVNTSPLGNKARALSHHCLVGAFHGHAHNRLCQLSNLATYKEGLGLEDLEGCERFFSKSNGLASSVRHASVFHRKQTITEYCKHLDTFETYQSLSTFLVNNYKQAVLILNSKPVLVRAMAGLGIDDEVVFEEWLEEEREYLRGLSKEPPAETLEMEYYQKLVNLAASQ